LTPLDLAANKFGAGISAIIACCAKKNEWRKVYLTEMNLSTGDLKMLRRQIEIGNVIRGKDCMGEYFELTETFFTGQTRRASFELPVDLPAAAVH
jgi:hypothetical protein